MKFSFSLIPTRCPFLAASLVALPAWSLVFFTAFHISGCANPDWGTPDSTIPTKESQKTAQCALHFTKLKLCGALVWNKTANDSETGELGLSFRSEDNLSLVDPSSTPFVYLWMPSMGHGSSPVAVERADLGLFRATGVFFVMPGNWDIHVQLKSGNQVVDEVTVPYFYKGGG